MARLAAARQRTEEELDKQRERLNQQFERIQDRLERKYGKPSDMQQRIIEAALGLLQQEGLANVSLRKLATKLDLQAPALYWHFKNKEVLVDYMAEAILQKELGDLQPRAEGEPWQEWLVVHMLRLRKAMLAYPDGARVVAGAHLYPAVTLARSLECGLASLTSDGVSLDTARRIMWTATTYTFGYVIEEQSSPSPEHMAWPDMEAFLNAYPHMTQAMRTYQHSTHASDDEYLAGLQLIVRV